jgi:hypothetical protein
MKPGFLYQLMNALGGQRPATARYGPPFHDIEPSRAPVRPRPASSGTASRWERRLEVTDALKATVWEKGQPIVGWDPNDWRVDHRGNPLFRLHYGDSRSSFGWEIGRIADGDADDVGNLRPQLCKATETTPARFGTPLNLDPFRR